MRANFRLQRLYVNDALAADVTIAASSEHFHYLANVLRAEDGTEVLLFNGRDGEWLCRVTYPTRKKIVLTSLSQMRPQPPRSDLVYLFAPLKIGRLDYLVQKAVEMGVGILQPVMTQHVQGKITSLDKLAANVVEAAEQCGILSVPDVMPVRKLTDVLDGWDRSRRIIFCDEGADSHNPLPILSQINERRLAVLVGPEGGFSSEEQALLRGLDFVTAIPLGPRILRADTAAVAALAVIQAAIGDWT